jgi:hypothetical protein
VIIKVLDIYIKGLNDLGFNIPNVILWHSFVSHPHQLDVRISPLLGVRLSFYLCQATQRRPSCLSQKLSFARHVQQMHWSIVAYLFENVNQLVSDVTSCDLKDILQFLGYLGWVMGDFQALKYLCMGFLKHDNCGSTTTSESLNGWKFLLIGIVFHCFFFLDPQGS